MNKQRLCRILQIQKSKISMVNKKHHMMINNIEITVQGKLIKTARLVNEWYEDVKDPEYFIKALKHAGIKADLFTFWQRLPQTTPIYKYTMEWDPVAAIPIKSFDHWWNNQIGKKVRHAVRKAEKKGVVIKIADFNDDFIRGIVDIYNETPIRQGKPFWHYGKDFETVKKENSTFLDKSEFIGAYYEDELIGFVKLTYMETYADPMQIISKIKHRDKSPSNALIAKAVEICSEKKLPYFPYGAWNNNSLADFKHNNGFERYDLPRYYIPLTFKGKIALKLHLHHGITGFLPEKFKMVLIDCRRRWYSRIYEESMQLEHNKSRISHNIEEIAQQRSPFKK